MSIWRVDPPLVIGHRGSPREAPENTLASFRAAEAAGATAIELDARLTRDGVVVVHHDAALGRVIAGSGLVEEQLALDLRARGVPTLEDVLRAFPRLLVDVELKADAGNADELPARVLAVVDACAGARERVLVTSFDPLLASDYAERAQTDAGFIVPFPLDPVDIKEHPRLRHVMLVADACEPEAIASLTSAGLRVAAWTVNDADDAIELLRRGVSSLITDRPGPLLQRLRRDAFGPTRAP